MAKIYSAPRGFSFPSYSKPNWKEEAETVLGDLKNWCIARRNQEYVGETIKFQVADGYAQYMICSMKPLELIHLDILDGYEFEYVHLLKAKDVKEKVDKQKAFELMWKKAKEEQQKK